MKRSSAGEARLRTLTKTYGADGQSVWADPVEFVQAVSPYWSVLWWDPREVGSRDDLQLLHNRQARCILGALLTTPQRALMKESGLTLAPVILDSRQQRFTAKPANACISKVKELHHNPSSGAPICRVIREEHEHGRRTDGRDWLPPGEESVVWNSILDDSTAAKSAAQRWAREKEAKVGVGVWMLLTDSSRSDDGPVRAEAVCKHGTQWRPRRSVLGTGLMEVFHTKLWGIGLAHDVAIEN